MDNNVQTIEQSPQQMDPTAVAQLVSALIAANVVKYPRLQVRLDGLVQSIATNDTKNLPQQVADLIQFVSTYKPIDKKMGEFLQQYGQNNAQFLQQLQQMVGEPSVEAEAPPKPVKPKIGNPTRGLYRFQFYSGDKLNFGDISIAKTIKQDLNVGATHYKLWKEINTIPFLVSGYPDDAYSCVTRVLASQVGKLLGLNCEECFFGDLNGKPVTLTFFKEAVTLLENETFKLYKMASNYLYQATQKEAFYFLIQNWPCYAIINGQVRERFERHYIDPKGNVFLSQHEQATFLTPQQMAPSLMVRLVLDETNYRPIKDLVVRVGDRDIADIAFSSIPQDMIDAHDEVAEATNKTLFDQKRTSFDSNWQRLLEAIEEFELSYQK